VFLHVPKCGGTYILGVIGELLRMYSYLKHRRTPMLNLITFDIVDYRSPHIKIFATDKMKFDRCYSNTYRYVTNLEEFLKLYATGQISVFAAACTSRLLTTKKQDELFTFLEKVDKQPVFFTALRTPYSRVMSMYYVHKKTQTILPSLSSDTPEGNLEEFSNFIISHDSEVDWLHRYLVYVFQKFNEDILLNFCTNYLHAEHTENCFAHIKVVFEAVYGTSLSKYLDFLPPDIVYKNQGIKHKIFTPEDLSDETLQKFKKLHAKDSAIVKALLPNLQYDSTDTCEKLLL
jgi:hypothetical protein